MRLKFLTMNPNKMSAHKDWQFIQLQEVDYKSEKMKFFKSGLNLIS